jgi:DNA-binding response OmpR family regulator
MTVKGSVLVIIEDGPLRALLSAQLDEDGFVATGIRNIPEAVSALSKRHGTVSLCVLDAGQQHIDMQSFGELNGICGEVPLVLLHGGLDKPVGIDWKGGIYSIARPVTIGEIVERIRAIIEKCQAI